MNILGIDTSCDDTSVAVVKDGTSVLSLTVTSQDEFHKKFGGVVPEIASRKHLELIMLSIAETLKQAGLSLADIDGIAVTNRPGLIGSLVIGIAAAKSLSYIRNIPLTGVNHLLGHAYALALHNDLSFPHLALIVSGGHTLTAIIERNWTMKVIGSTRDDAAGECLDKVSKMLGLGYPGGKLIDERAARGNRNAFSFPRPMLKDRSPHFSFSGLKTSVRVFLEHVAAQNRDYLLDDLLASVQEAVMDVLEAKTRRTARQVGLNLVTVSGGVAANSRLRELFQERSEKKGLTVLFPPIKFCTDNAAVIAGLGFHHIKQGLSSGLDLNAEARLAIS